MPPASPASKLITGIFRQNCLPGGETHAETSLFWRCSRGVIAVPGARICVPSSLHRSKASNQARHIEPDSQAKSSAQTTQPASEQKDSLVAAARRAREEKKEQPKPAKVFTNDNVPTAGGISSVGETPPAAADGDVAAAAPNAAPSKSAADEEKGWRERFAKLRHKLEQDQQELDVMQRELGVLDVQYYNNPVKAMQQELTRSDINKKTTDIDAKKAQIEADKQGHLRRRGRLAQSRRRSRLGALEVPADGARPSR